MEEERMDLEAIPQLAWFKLLQFLDNESRLQCRLLSSTIKGYVDYVGIHLRIDGGTLLKIPADKEAWENFLDTPELYFGIVHLASVGEELVDLGLTAQHQVQHLKMSRAISLDWLVKWNWTKDIVKLSLQDFFLPLSHLFENYGNEDVIFFPSLRNLYLRSCGITCNWPEALADQQRAIMVVLNTATMLRKVRSGCLDSIYVELELNQHVDVFAVCSALAESIQAHSDTLQSLTYFDKTAFCKGLAWGLVPQFTSIPYGLKHIHVDFLPHCSSDSSWRQLIKKLKHVEQFTCDTSFLLDDRVDPTMDITKTVCEHNFRTLKYIALRIDWGDTEAPQIDLSIFGCCSQMEFLYLYGHAGRDLKNLRILPTSLKVLQIKWLSTEAAIILEEEDVVQISKFRKLVEFSIGQSLKFRNHELLFRFSSAILRLPKLNIVDVSEMTVSQKEEDRNFEYDVLCQDLFKNLCEDEDVGPSKSTDGIEPPIREPCMRVTLVHSITEDISESEHEGETFEEINYLDVYGPVTNADKIRTENEICYKKQLKRFAPVEQAKFLMYSRILTNSA